MLKIQLSLANKECIRLREEHQSITEELARLHSSRDDEVAAFAAQIRLLKAGLHKEEAAFHKKMSDEVVVLLLSHKAIVEDGS